jgi:hypothetical protein
MNLSSQANQNEVIGTHILKGQRQSSLVNMKTFSRHLLTRKLEVVAVQEDQNSAKDNSNSHPAKADLVSKFNMVSKIVVTYILQEEGLVSRLNILPRTTATHNLEVQGEVLLASLI